MKNLEFLTGRTTDQLIPFQDGTFLIHKAAAHDLNRLFKRAAADGIDLAMTSSFRSYEAQKTIWNNKASGVRAVLDSDSIEVDISHKTKEEILFLILRWSAIPGGSRHHWGTDLDVFDKKAIAPDYKVQLVPSEYEAGGPFHPASLWLSENMELHGFYRPYSQDRGGIAPEPWHISYRPVSESLMEELTFDLFLKHLEQSDFLLREEAIENAADIYRRFIRLP
ncbi:MAG: M15 family metallopeptidase [Bacteriovorax sp.]|jgi:LAS superfamily LD-carboxypeptidase LdcB